MDPVAEARRRQQEKYQQQKAALEAEEAAKVKKQQQDAIRQKIEAQAQKHLRYTHFDWAATRLQRFFRKRIQSRPRLSEPVVIVSKASYSFSVATQLYDAGEAPFDSRATRSIYDAVSRKKDNYDHFGSRDYQLSPEAACLFLLACLCKHNQPDVELLFGIFEESTIAHLISLDLHEHPDLSRSIRLLNLLQNQVIPPPIFENLPPCNSEELTMTLEQDIQFQLEEIVKSQARLEETFSRPDPDDEVQCTSCQEPHLARDMHSAPRGSFLYCTNCAPRFGIFPQVFFHDDGDF